MHGLYNYILATNEERQGTLTITQVITEFCSKVYTVKVPPTAAKSVIPRDSTS